MIWEILIVVGLLFFIIVNLVSLSKKQEIKQIKEKHQIQEGEIKYTDLDKPTKPLFSNKIKLVGKPDYIVKQEQTYIPVEIKKGYPTNPFQSHIMQLIAYCYLVEDLYNVKVPYGVLIYEDYQIRIPYSEDKKTELLETLSYMRTKKHFERNHNHINKCRACSFNHICKDKISI